MVSLPASAGRAAGFRRMVEGTTRAPVSPVEGEGRGSRVLELAEGSSPGESCKKIGKRVEILVAMSDIFLYSHSGEKVSGVSWVLSGRSKEDWFREDSVCFRGLFPENREQH